MPLWLIVLGTLGVFYLLSKGNQQAAAAGGALPSPSSSPSTTNAGGSPSQDFPGPGSVPSAATIGSSISLPSGQALFSDSKLTKSAGSLGSAQSVTVASTSVAQDGSISISFVDASGTTKWFAQPGT
jgi:hypothetical protein